MDEMATEQDAMREFAANVAEERKEQPWILTPYDVWVKTPAYTGPEVPHPEDY